MMLSRKIFILILTISAPLIMNGCGYLAKQGAEVVKHQSRAIKIDKLLADEGIDPDKRAFLERVTDIRLFAVESIGLKRNKNYTLYVDIDRDYMLDVVVASEDDSFRLYKWWFPITGSVPYKGFFNRADAEKEVRKIGRRGNYDINIGKADAFSTLGILSDPIYSFMVNYDVYDLASLIIHEQTHATIWVKSQTQLNEEIATFVGDMGGLWYVRDRFGEDSDEYRAAVLHKEDYGTYIDLMRNLYNELKALYDRDDVDRQYKLAEKERIFEEFRTHVDGNYDALFRTQRCRGLKQTRLNNAVIASRMTYNLDMGLFHELYEVKGGDLVLAVNDLKGLNKVKKDHKDYIRAILATSPDTGRRR